MRIVIDLQGAQTESRFRGIGRYSLSLAQSIARNARDDQEIWIGLNSQIPENIPELRNSFIGLIPQDRIRIFNVPDTRCARGWLQEASEKVREHFYETLNPDILLVTSIFEGPWANAVTSIGSYSKNYYTAAVLYDLIPLMNEDRYLPSDELKQYYHRKLKWLKNADLLLSISEYSRNEGVDNLSILPDKVVNISTAVNEEFRPSLIAKDDLNKIFEIFGITRKIVMYAPGGFDPRKNIHRLIEGYSLLPKRIRGEYQLVIVSKLLPSQSQEIFELSKLHGLGSDEVVLTGYVKDQELIALYSSADLFIFPSIHEGFGLPVLEAMSCGAAVIGSDRTSIPEVIGRSDALFNPFSPEEIEFKIREVIDNSEFRRELQRFGLLQAQKFNWDKTGKLALEAMENCIGKNNNNKEAKSKNNYHYIVDDIAKIVDKNQNYSKGLIDIALALSHNINSSCIQILLDISTLIKVDAKSGIQRVVRSLLLELSSKSNPQFSIRPIYYDNGIYRYANEFSRLNLGKKEYCSDDPVEFCQDDIYLSLDLNMHLTKNVHNLHMRLKDIGVKIFFIVYDLLLIQHPHWWKPELEAMYRDWLLCSSQVAKGMICISETVAEDLRQWLESNQFNESCSRPDVHSFHLGSDIKNSLPSLGLPESADAVLHSINSKPSFLMTGTIEPRKGHRQVLSAFDLLWKSGQDINLVFVGKRGWLVDELITRIEIHPESNLRLYWLEGISDEYLEKIYSASTCLIAASEAEGFGLPLIEAAHHKKPIIARDIPVFHEVAGDFAYYFSGKEPDDLVKCINDWLALFQKDQHPKSDDMPRLSWKQSADSLLRLVLE